MTSFILCVIHAIAQNRFFLDKTLQRLPDTVHAAYYITSATVSDNYYRIEGYYLSGKLWMTGYSLYPDSIAANGYCVYYDSAGHKISEGRYIAGKQKGIYWLL